MNPLFTLDDILAQLNLTPRDCVTGSVALSAIILAFMYFTLGWATNRMKSADDSHHAHRGSPGIICWTSSMGTLAFTILGTQFFAPMYFALNSRIYIWHLLPLLAMLYICGYFWICLIRMLILHRRYNGKLCPFTNEMLNTIHDYRRGFWITITSIFVVGWSTFIETLIGDFPAGIMGICFFLISVAGLGSYISLNADLFPRALASDEAV